MGKIVDELKKLLESDDFYKFLDKVEYSDKLEKKYSDKFRSFSVGKQNELIEKVINKYESKEYKDREYSKGRFPEEYLYGFLFSFANQYCPDVTQEYSEDPFLFGAFRINDKFDIVGYSGQGIIYKVYKL